MKMGADVNMHESHGASCAWRLCRTAADTLAQYHLDEEYVCDTAVMTPEWEHDLGRIFLLLKRCGVDFSEQEIQVYKTKPNHPLIPFLELIDAD